MPVIAVVGGQWGDEGKGKVIDLLARKAHAVVRAQGGDNAGHTVVNDQGKFALHLVPAGVFNPSTTCIIGAGVALNPAILLEEMDLLQSRGVQTSNLLISDRAHLVMPYHLVADRQEESGRGERRIGTTGRGIGPTYVDKVARVGLRTVDLLEPDLFLDKLRLALRRYRNGTVEADVDEVDLTARYLTYAQRLAPHIAAVEPVVERAVRSGQTVLLEGAHGTLLDLDHGTYPYVTSSSPTVAGLLLGAGVGPRYLTHAVGVFKAYTTRVGAGPFPTEQENEIGEHLRQRGQEYGTTTGRPRRCGWFDVVAARHSVRINGFDAIALTRLDILDELPVLRICTAYRLDGQIVEHFPASAAALSRCEPVYEELPGWERPTGEVRSFEDLPSRARAYVRRLEELLGAPVALIGVGADREQTIPVGTTLAGVAS